MAALALVTAACSDDNDIILEQPTGQLVPFTATITLDDAATTRALSGPDGNNNINAEWETGDHVALVYKKGSNSHDYVVKVADATVTAKRNKTATISARLDLTENEANRYSDITLIYPYSAVITSGDGIGQVRSELWANQTGTVADISQYRDLRSGSGTMRFMTTPNGSSIELGSDVIMSPRAAIWKLTLSQAIDATCPLSITDSDNDVLLTTVTPASETNEVYVALPSTDAKKTYKFSVTKNGFEYSKTGKAQLEAGRYYQTSLTLAVAIKTLSKVTSANIGCIVGSDGLVYPPSATMPDGVSKVAMICYVSDTGHALAIELNNNPSSATWANAKSAAASKTTVAGGTWQLPSKDDWQDMVDGCGDVNGFISKFNATGFTFTDFSCWTSSGFDSQAWCIALSGGVSGGNIHFIGQDVSQSSRYYAVLAFDTNPTPLDLSEVTSDHIGRIVGNDGKVYPSVAALPSGVTAVAMISYLKEGYDGFGLAIELNSNPAKAVWQVANLNPTSMAAVAGGTWRLPLKDDWNDMVAGCGGAAGFISKYNATGVTFDTSKNYWLSDYDSSTGRFYYTWYFVNEFSFKTDDGSNKNYYLGVLAFNYSSQPDYGIPLSEVTSKHIGRIVGSDGKAHDPNYTLPTGVTPVAMICYVKTGGGGWAIELNENPSYGKQTAARKMEDKPNVPKNDVSLCKWSLPTKAQWCKMIAVCAGGNPDVDYESVNSSSCKTFIAQYNATGVYFKKDTPLWMKDRDGFDGTYIKISSSDGAEFGTSDDHNSLNYLGMLEF